MDWPQTIRATCRHMPPHAIEFFVTKRFTAICRFGPAPLARVADAMAQKIRDGNGWGKKGILMEKIHGLERFQLTLNHFARAIRRC